MTAPRSNGAVVTDETPTSDVSVNFNFAITGTGGVLQVFQSDQVQSITSGYPAADDLGWVDAVDVNGNPPPNSATVLGTTWSHYGFTQPRGTKLYYYCRRKNGSTIELGSPYPVTEIVPSQPYISAITHNASFTTATLASQVPDPYTTLYYNQSTTAVKPVWEAQSPTQTAPDPSVWQTSPTFATTPNETYFYYALGWTHNNPAEDGAAISPVASREAGDKFGLRVWDASNNIRLDTTDRMIRHHSTLSGTITQAASPVSLFVSGIANDGTWGMSNDVPLSGDYSSTDDVSLTFGSTNYITLALQHTNSGSFNYRVQVFRI